MTPTITLRQALSDPQLLGLCLRGESWRRWRVLLISAMGETLRDDERVLFRELTGRECEPGRRVDEFAAVIGRRGGKSKAMATLAAYIAGLCQHPLVRGEKGVLLAIAPDQRQATIVLGYAAAAFEASPILKQLIAGRTSDTLELTNGISIEARAASFRRLRGPTYAAVICDEAAFWFAEEGANPDIEIVNAVRPGLATTGGPLIIASSPYARRGLLWDLHRRHFGANGDPLILVAQGATRQLNPSLPEAVITRAYERDAASAAAEYGAQFRCDIESFVSREAVESCTAPGVVERAPLSNLRYFGFVDPSGGSADGFSLAIGHREKAGDVVVLDVCREIKPPFSPEAVVGEFCGTLKSYRVQKVSGDRYAGEWPREQFRKLGVVYQPSEQPKGALYQALLPLLNSRKIDLLDQPKLLNQLCGLERRVARGGRDSIDHAPGGHDDLANALAGVASLAKRGSYVSDLSWVNGPDYDGVDPAAAAARAWQDARFAAHVFGGRRYGWW